MQYVRWPKNNFGDNLNDIIFDRLGVTNKIAFKKTNLQNLPPNTYLGLGTLLTNKLRSKTTVCGSGVDGNSVPSVPQDYLFVRGKLSAQKLGISQDYALGDTAYFLTEFIQSLAADKKTRKIGVIPHWQTNYTGADAIPVTLPVDEFIYRVSECEYIHAEAMHGAICADILRIPFTPVVLGRNFNHTKWLDWASVLEIPLEFNSRHCCMSSDKKLIETSENIINTLTRYFGKKHENA